MKRVIHFWIILLFAVAPLTAGAEVVDRIVAVVNGEIITLQELHQRAVSVGGAANLDDSAENAPLMRKVLDALIIQKLVEQEGAKLGIKVSDKDVDDTLNRLVDSGQLTQKQLQQEIERRGGDIALFKRDIRADMVRARIINEEIRSRVAIPERDILAYYQKEHGGASPDKPKVTLRNIFLEIPEGAGQDMVEARKNYAEKILKEIRDGKGFAEAAKEYSEAPNAENGGMLGASQPGRSRPEGQGSAGGPGKTVSAANRSCWATESRYSRSSVLEPGWRPCPKRKRTGSRK